VSRPAEQPNSSSRSSVIQESQRGALTSYNEETCAELSRLYHKTKVEVAMLRRRLLRTENPDQVATLQDKLSRTRKDLNRMNDDLRRMRELKRIGQDGSNEKGGNREDEGEDEDDTEVGFAVPREQPQYSEAPEFNRYSKNHRAAENDDDDGDDIDISEELHEYDTERLVQFDSSPTYTATLPTKAKAVDAEEEDDADDRDAAPTPPVKPAPRAHATMKRSETLAVHCEELFSAATAARKGLENVLKEKEDVEARYARRVRDATEKLDRTEEELEAARMKHQEAVDAEMREHVEAKARAVEEELRVQREHRLSAVDKQREKARIAQLEAQRALECQQRTEAEALEKELELERRLRQVRAELRAVEQGSTGVAGEKSNELPYATQDSMEEQ